MLSEIWNKSRLKSNSFIAGSDEVGRGPLAGPVVAATVMLKIKGENSADSILSYLDSLEQIGITDSKKLTAKKREKLLRSLLIEVAHIIPKMNYCLVDNPFFSISFCLSEISPAKIDKINILNASMLAMKESFDSLKDVDSGLWLVDGNRSPVKDGVVDVEISPIIKGDSKDVLIGLASIIAKEYRDSLMAKLGNKYPGYGFENHAGYPTVFHKEAIRALGVSEIHRKTFKGVKEWVVEKSL
jgi:ribonuclease HII